MLFTVHNKWCISLSYLSQKVLEKKKVMSVVSNIKTLVILYHSTPMFGNVCYMPQKKISCLGGWGKGFLVQMIPLRFSVSLTIAICLLFISLKLLLLSLAILIFFFLNFQDDVDMIFLISCVLIKITAVLLICFSFTLVCCDAVPRNI